jgi:hypothetical protein
MELLDDTGIVEQRSLEIELAVQVGHVSLDPGAVARDFLVTGAVITKRLAKRQVNVDGQWPALGTLVAGRALAAVFGLTEPIVKLNGGRIGGVTGTPPAITLDQIGIKTYLIHSHAP